MSNPLFSICIPNYNYEKYLAETLKSVGLQDYNDFEIIVCDNNSTDRSWQIAQDYGNADARIKAFQNEVNIGFAGNLDATCSKAIGKYQILVSSDDLMNSGALSFYKKFLDAIEDHKIVVSSSCDRIDDNGKIIGYDGPKSKLWWQSDIDSDLSKMFGCNIYRVPANAMMKRCLDTFYGPFNFVSTFYPSKTYKQIGGYSGSRMMNPDKWFHWRLLNAVDYVYFIDCPLFSYRWHNNNQTALLKKSGALKFFVDEYRSSFELEESTLQKLGLTKKNVEESFVYNVIHKYTFRKLKEGNRLEAFRILSLGFASYPNIMFKKRYTYGLIFLILSGRFGHFFLKRIKRNYETIY